MNRIIIFLMSLGIYLVSSSGEAKVETSFKIEGRNILVVVEKLTPPLEVDAHTSNPSPVIEAYLTYQRLLAAGNIKAAALLTQSPQTKEKIRV